jgi:acetyltransferase
VRLRPVRAQDTATLDAFVRGLSLESRQRRFHGGMAQLPPDLLHRFTHPDPDGELALLAFATEGGREVCVGEARYALSDETPCDREFALAVADRWQGMGIGSGLLRTLTEHAERHGVERLYGDVLRDNLAMAGLARRQGYAVVRHPADPRLLRVTRTFAAAAPWALTFPGCWGGAARAFAGEA